MVTVVYRVVAKQGKEEKFKDVALECQQLARASDECLYYTFFQSLANPREFIVYYRFKNKKAQDKHILNLQEKIGPAQKGRDLPDNFLNLLSDEELVVFKLK